MRPIQAEDLRILLLFNTENFAQHKPHETGTLQYDNFHNPFNPFLFCQKRRINTSDLSSEPD